MGESCQGNAAVSITTRWVKSALSCMGDSSKISRKSYLLEDRQAIKKKDPLVWVAKLRRWQGSTTPIRKLNQFR
jgi:hypothetical protein